MQKKQVVITILFVGMAVFIQGCVIAAVGAGAGTVAYVRGDLQTVESKSLDDVYEATEKAIKELGLNVTKKTKDAMSATIVARDAQDKKITIKLSASTEETTKLSIRIGVFGSETKSRRIYEEIKKNL
ncbi:MAG: DUF3568 family protein [Sedimentisphaerales bacterium]